MKISKRLIAIFAGLGGLVLLLMVGCPRNSSEPVPETGIKSPRASPLPSAPPEATSTVEPMGTDMEGDDQSGEVPSMVEPAGPAEPQSMATEGFDKQIPLPSGGPAPAVPPSGQQ